SGLRKPPVKAKENDFASSTGSGASMRAWAAWSVAGGAAWSSGVCCGVSSGAAWSDGRPGLAVSASRAQPAAWTGLAPGRRDLGGLGR
ncbi:unnamed protein product, partial [Urochloa humidicola]